MAAQGRKDYLQRYIDKPEADRGQAKSKKKKRKGKGTGGGGNAGLGVIIVDNDAIWHRERKAEEDEDEPDEEGEGPTVIEDVEVKRMKRMEALKIHRPYLSMANDGSGWVTVKDDEGGPEAASAAAAAALVGGDDNSSPRSPQGMSPGPPSKRKRMDSPELSPPRRRKGSLDAPLETKVSSHDLDPPRRSKFSTGDPSRTRRHSPDQHVPRGRHDSSDDLSPARSRRPAATRNRNEAQDLSPPRRRRDSPDLLPARKLISKDLSPPRKPKSSMASPKQQSRSEDSSPPRKKGSGRMTDGTFAGLKSDREVVSEAQRKRAAEEKILSELDPSLSGRGAETVFRDKRGRRLEGLEEMLRQQRGEAKPAEQPLEWGKGLAQKKVAEANIAELEAEKSKPFARYRDDAELDKSLKERLRWGDPMAHLVKQKTSELVLEDLGTREEMKASGFIIPQDIPKHSWLKRGTAPPPNRYDIRPGRHWDGVDRSTGFEQGLFKQKNEKKARDLEAYLWSVSDM